MVIAHLAEPIGDCFEFVSSRSDKLFHYCIIWSSKLAAGESKFSGMPGQRRTRKRKPQKSPFVFGRFVRF